MLLNQNAVGKVLKIIPSLQAINCHHIDKTYISMGDCQFTVKPVKTATKIDTTNILMANGRLMKVESIAECSPWSILQYF